MFPYWELGKHKFLFCPPSFLLSSIVLQIIMDRHDFCVNINQELNFNFGSVV